MMMPTVPPTAVMCMAIVPMSVIAGVVLVASVASVVGVVIAMMTVSDGVISDVMQHVIDREQPGTGDH